MKLAEVITILEAVQDAARRQHDDRLTRIRDAVLDGDCDAPNTRGDALKTLRDAGAIEARDYVLDLLRAVEAPAPPEGPEGPAALTVPDGWPPGWSPCGVSRWNSDDSHVGWAEVTTDGDEARAAGWDRSEESDRVEDARWMAWALYARRPKVGGGA